MTRALRLTQRGCVSLFARQKSRNITSRTTKGGTLSVLLAATTDTGLADLGKAIAFGVGVGLGAVGAGIGIGNIFGSMIQAVARQPELRGELTGIQWLGFALTEAVVFYALLGGLLAYVLV
jgi:F-type H+-transporting ATPase subunit c